MDRTWLPAWASPMHTPSHLPQCLQPCVPHSKLVDDTTIAYHIRYIYMIRKNYPPIDPTPNLHQHKFAPAEERTTTLPPHQACQAVMCGTHHSLTDSTITVSTPGRTISCSFGRGNFGSMWVVGTVVVHLWRTHPRSSANTWTFCPCLRACL